MKSPAAELPCLERFPAKWIPVRVKKTRQNKKIEPRSDSIGTEKALERFSPGTQVEFERPGAAVLMVQHPIGIGDGGDVEEAVRATRILQFRPQAEQAIALDAAVDDDVPDMDSLRPEFARHALGERTQRRLGRGKRRKIGLAAQRCACAGENQRAAAARQQRWDRRLRQMKAAERVLAPMTFEAFFADLEER